MTARHKFFWPCLFGRLFVCRVLTTNALRRCVLRKGAVPASEIDQGRTCPLMPGKAQNPSDQDGMVAGLLDALARAFEHGQGFRQRRWPKFGGDQCNAIQAVLACASEPG